MPRSPFRPAIEPLEDRHLLAVSVTETVVHSFGGTVPQVFPAANVPDGVQPEGDVTLSPDGSTLYGRTFLGGQDNLGVLFTVGVTGTGYEILHSFAGQANGDGANPRHNRMLLSADGTTLYGMTVAGGTDDHGTLFTYDLAAPPATAYPTPHSFKDSKGSTPHGTVISSADGSTLYGMTELGGDQGKGVLFAMDVATQDVTVLYSFGQTPDGTKSAAFGEEPHGSLILVGMHLYGMTRKGGVAPDGSPLDFGVVFDYQFGTSPSTSPSMTILHTFGGQPLGDGATPYHANLTFANGVLYGMTTEGGSGTAPGNGIIFSYNLDPTSTSPYTVLHTFTGQPNDGANPEGTLSFINGQLYGVSAKGGQNNKGALFSFNPDGTNFQVLYSFAGPDGDHPIDSLAPIVNPNGSITFYGMTQQGGQFGGGVIFAITVTLLPEAVPAQPVVVPVALRRRRERLAEARVVARVLAFLAEHRFVPPGSRVAAKVVRAQDGVLRVRVTVSLGGLQRLLWVRPGAKGLGIEVANPAR